MRLRRLRILGIALCAIGAIIACASASAAGFECLIEPYQVVEIRSSVEGLIEKVNVKRGDHVRKGQVLVQLVSDVERATADSAKYRIAMEGKIQGANNRIDYSTKKLKRFEELSKSNFVSRQQHDEAETEKRLAEADLKDAIENREFAKLEYDRAVAQLKLRALTSPFDGIVVERMLNPGDLAESGTGRKPMLKLAQIDPLRVEVVLPLAAHGKIQLGTKAEVIPEGGFEKQSATVTVVDKVLDAASGTFGVRLDLANPKQRLPAGIRCHASFPGVNAEPTGGKPGRLPESSRLTK
jgi:RND family efflux transporter MFP subunit